MIVIHGKGVFGGVAIGTISFFSQKQQQIKRTHVDNPDREIARFKEAKDKAIEDLGELYEKALADVGEESAMIFQIHQMMLEDLDYLESIETIIRDQKTNAEYAVAITADNFAEMFSTMDDDYMRERAADVKDVSERLIKILSGQSEDSFRAQEPVIVAADDLAPSETVQLDKSMVLGFVTKQGSANSHTAILARTMNIPAIIGTGDSLTEEYNGKLAVLDGFTGTLYVDPDEQTVSEMKAKQKEALEQMALLQQLRGQENVTQDGQTVSLYANIGNVGDTAAVLDNDAGGIGLFRSEFLYLENLDYPTEEEQFAVYRTVAEKMDGKRVIIRTLDIGADKQIDYFHLPKEENPAMGMRAIRICLTRPEIFRTQLRALLRASAYGKIAIMFPMITSVSEVLVIKEILNSVKEELIKEGIPFDKEIEIGIMIETPAAVIISDDLAKEVDFFSIGTNDLTQYTLAIDRQNNDLNRFFDPHHKAILRMIKTVADNAHKNGIWMGICGELAADLELTETFLAMGVDELSVSPAYLLHLRKKVRETNVQEIKERVLSLLQ